MSSSTSTAPAVGSHFDRAIPILLEEEGGLVDDPKDPGGLTNYGISRRSYPHVDIRALTPEGAAAIYARDFWAASGANRLPWPLCLFVLDHAVNAGCVAAIKCLQRAAHVGADGQLGPITLGAVERANLRLLCRQFNVERCRYYMSLSGFPTFGLSWLGRVASVALKAGWGS